MKKNDAVLFYHSVSEKQVVGVARVVKEAYADPTAKEGDWSCVDVSPLRNLTRPVTLHEIKADKSLRNIALVRQSRLSVTPLQAAEFERILELGNTTLPAKPR